MSVIERWISSPSCSSLAPTATLGRDHHAIELREAKSKWRRRAPHDYRCASSTTPTCTALRRSSRAPLVRVPRLVLRRCLLLQLHPRGTRPWPTDAHEQWAHVWHRTHAWRVRRWWMAHIFAFRRRGRRRARVTAASSTPIHLCVAHAATASPSHTTHVEPDCEDVDEARVTAPPRLQYTTEDGASVEGLLIDWMDY